VQAVIKQGFKQGLRRMTEPSGIGYYENVGVNGCDIIDRNWLEHMQKFNLKKNLFLKVMNQ